MGFLHLKQIIERERDAHPALREVGKIDELRQVWETRGIALIPAPLRAHARSTVRLEAFRRECVVLRTEDASTAALIMMVRRDLLEVFRGRCPELSVRDIVIRHS
ncbi:MAG: DUF721 domain-containing protein [Candidatus Terrybacteria bacterium]|nr:DUF721 domain-containing protein [Candidatus Terrybacteria bacterium]